MATVVGGGGGDGGDGGPAAAATIHTLKEWEACKRELCGGEVLLLQMGSPGCERCPAVSERIQALKTERKFKHVYCNIHAAEEDLYEELRVTQLPAYVLITGDKTLAGEAATPEQVAQEVHSVCPGVLLLDADF